MDFKVHEQTHASAETRFSIHTPKVHIEFDVRPPTSSARLLLLQRSHVIPFILMQWNKLLIIHLTCRESKSISRRQALKRKSGSVENSPSVVVSVEIPVPRLRQAVGEVVGVRLVSSSIQFFPQARTL